MGARNLIINENRILGVWDCDESLDELLRTTSLTDYEKEQYKEFSNDRRKLEYLATRKLLKEIYPIGNIIYDIEGRPALSDGKCISISHSHGKVFIGISANPIGVDVELLREKILKIQHKFLHNNEAKYKDDVHSLTIIWSAKESLFKLYSRRFSMDFHAEMAIGNLNTTQNEGTLTALVCKGELRESIKINFFKIDAHIFTYTLNN